MIHIYLDDYRRCPAGFALARNAEECKLLLDSEDVDLLSLDFELGYGEPNGMEVVRHILETGRFPRRIYMHTSSPSGRMQMYAALMERAPKDVLLVNGPMPDSLIEEIGRTSSNK
ncbi:cell division protein FtsJ [Paenibacillus sambharensis]|uniref:Cell division protein FtsJ n=1 Tax=Paenibacillus sambharensis TaxID=1803190 RepID=A0A2W1LGT0_9BACL|nr:cyclic-phosphate processing receiver domain-containing protein [Paenibacillus sambharensis]PZD93664.1 cell division protein FtsJ [Paenibacillus sambharensis]